MKPDSFWESSRFLGKVHGRMKNKQQFESRLLLEPPIKIFAGLRVPKWVTQSRES
jgi:hypothetical protein